jgi:hypothetical protein
LDDDDRSPEALRAAIEDWWIEHYMDYAIEHEPTTFGGLRVENKGVDPQEQSRMKFWLLAQQSLLEEITPANWSY